MGEPRILDLFCGAGGAAQGYANAGFEVVGVDIAPQPNYPFEFIHDDALSIMERFGTELWRFDAIHASPPCQRYSALRALWSDREHPDLLAPTIALLRQTGLPFVVENVDGAPFPDDIYRIRLCGSTFGLRTIRHRWFALNFAMLAPPCQHDSTVDYVGVYGNSDGEHGPGFKHPGIRRGPRQASTREAREVMEMPWAKRRRELTEAIPPAYTEHIGSCLLTHLAQKEVAA